MNEKKTLELMDKLVANHREYARIVGDIYKHTGVWASRNDYIQMLAHGARELAKVLDREIVESEHDDELIHCEFIYNGVCMIFLETKEAK